MIDLRYHIVSIIAVFLALGVGVLIGSTIVSDDLMVAQQKKIIDSLEEKFTSLRERESNLLAQQDDLNRIIDNYENFSQVVLPSIVKGQLQGRNVAVIVTGGQNIPAGLLSSLSDAGANVQSQTVVLSNINLKDNLLCQRLVKFYGLDDKTTVNEIREKVAASIALIIANHPDQGAIKFLNDNKLIKVSGSYYHTVDSVILVGGAENLNTSFPDSFDSHLINALLLEGRHVFGVEVAKVNLSYMEAYQKYNVTTIDNIDMSLGQIALVLAMAGEPGDYGIKATASKFMPSLPVEYFRRQ